MLAAPVCVLAWADMRRYFVSTVYVTVVLPPAGTCTLNCMALAPKRSPCVELGRIVH